MATGVPFSPWSDRPEWHVKNGHGQSKVWADWWNRCHSDLASKLKEVCVMQGSLFGACFRQHFPGVKFCVETIFFLKSLFHLHVENCPWPHFHSMATLLAF